MKPTTLALGHAAGRRGPALLRAGRGGLRPRRLRRRRPQMLEAAFKMGADGIKFQLFRAELLVVRRHPGRKDFDQIELTREGVAEGPARGAGLRPGRCSWRPSTRPSLELAAGGGRRRLQGPHHRHGEPGVHPRGGRGWASPSSSPPAACPRTRCARRSTSRAARPSACCTASRPSPRRSRRSASASSRPGRSATACRWASSTTPTAAARSRWWRPRWPRPTGANLVEKHFTLDRSEKGFDYQSSLNPEDFYRMVELLRQAERGGGRRRRPRESEARAALPPR